MPDPLREEFEEWERRERAFLNHPVIGDTRYESHEREHAFRAFQAARASAPVATPAAEGVEMLTEEADAKPFVQILNNPHMPPELWLVTTDASGCIVPLPGTSFIRMPPEWVRAYDAAIAASKDEAQEGTPELAGKGEGNG